MTSISLVMSDQSISNIGDCEELARSCKNVLELDLAKNDLNDWNEVKKLLNSLKRLRLLNLSHNPLNNNNINRMNNDQEDDNDDDELTINYFNIEWPINNENNLYHQLKILILNSCNVDLKIIECLLNRLPDLNELHLASNNYSIITFTDQFVKYSLKILYFNNNNLSNWNEVCKLGKCFPNLENLVLSHNDLSNFSSIDELHTSKCFQNLEILILNKLKINEWSVIDQLREFPHLKHVRIQNIPLLNSYNDEEKYYLLVAHLNESIDSLNGSKITDEDKENCERKYIRHYLDIPIKPPLYYQLENKHGKLNKLADVNLEGNKRVQVKIKFRDQHIYERIDVRQTVGDFKKQLEKFVGLPSSRFKVFYIDIEACSMSIYGPEELKHLNRCLYSFNIRDGDEIEIDLKPPPPTPVIHSTNNEQHIHFHNHNHHHHHHHHNHNHQNNFSGHLQTQSTTLSKPLTIRNRKISSDNNQNTNCFDSNSSNLNNNSNINNNPTNSSSITPTSRLCKKTRSGLSNLSNSATATEPGSLKSESKLRKSSFFQFRNKNVQKQNGEEEEDLNNHNENVAFSYDESNNNGDIASHNSESGTSQNLAEN